MVLTTQPSKEHFNYIFIDELLLWIKNNHINLTLFVIVVEVPQQQPTCCEEYSTRHTMQKSMQIESTPREGTTTKGDLEMDEPINKYLKNKKQKKKWLYILWETCIMKTYFDDNIY